MVVRLIRPRILLGNVELRVRGDKRIQAIQGLKERCGNRRAGDSPLVKGDYDEKLPILELLPGDRVMFQASLTLATATTFDAVLTWTEADGSEKRREMQVSAT